MTGSLFMAGQHHFNIFLLMQHVENLQDDAAREREDGFHPFPFQAFDEDFGPGERHSQPSSPSAMSLYFSGGDHSACGIDERTGSPLIFQKRLKNQGERCAILSSAYVSVNRTWSFDKPYHPDGLLFRSSLRGVMGVE